MVALAVAGGGHRIGRAKPPARHAGSPVSGWAKRAPALLAAASAPTTTTEPTPARTAVEERIAAVRPFRASRSGVERPARVRPAAGAVTGVFGEFRGSHFHPGVDIDGETGDPVWAAAPGVVVHAGPAPEGWSGYGTIVVVDHGNDIQTMYAHLSAVTVAASQAVLAGDTVGAIGTTGSVTGSHLHFEVRITGQVVDPFAWLAAVPPS